MPNIKQIVVMTERLLNELKRDYPNLVSVAHTLGGAITVAGVGFTLGQVADSAKTHDPHGKEHSVHHHP